MAIRPPQIEKSAALLHGKLEEALSENKVMFQSSRTHLGNALEYLRRSEQLILDTGYFEDKPALITGSLDVSQMKQTIADMDTTDLKVLQVLVNQAVADRECKEVTPAPEVPKSPDKVATTTVDPEVKKEKRGLVIAYGHTLKAIAESTDENTTFGKLADVLYRWYYNRMIVDNNSKRGWKRLNYNTEWINEWICMFVMCFGYKHENDEEDAFIDECNHWIDSLGKDKDITEKYKYPQSVGTVTKLIREKHGKKYCTMSAWILWDMLLDHGYEELCWKHKQFRDAPRSDIMDKYMEKYNPELADSYIGADNEDFLREYNFITGKECDEE